MSEPILIVGGGLAGLTVAYELHRAGVGFVLMEARDRLGGRILSSDASGQASADGFDLGPSWFWPGMQPAMGELVSELGLQAFVQHSDGDMVFQRTAGGPPQRFPSMRQEPASMRLTGGTNAVIAALASMLPTGCLRLNTRVTSVAMNGRMLDIGFSDGRGEARHVRASHVVFALPPRLLEATVSFSPALEEATSRLWHATPTWMAPHAKFFALYDRPFWRDAGLSGTAQSMVGPLIEIHDATTASGQAALFGFVGVPADRREAAGRDAVIAASVQQLAQLFGPEAGTPRATLLKDWAADPLTATADDRQGGDHPVVIRQPWVSGVWRDRITLAGSETSRTEPGYLSGAVEAARRAAATIIGRKAAP